MASVHASPVHEVAKATVESISLIEGRGVEGDAHFGTTVQHLSRIRQDPTQPNLRQVHLIDSELIRRAGVMAIVVTSGAVSAGDSISIEMPAGPHRRLERV